MGRAKLAIGKNRDAIVKPSHPRDRQSPAAELPELDRRIHERIRLGILSALAINDSLSFNDLKRLLKTTDGNLSVHARKLEEAHYISCNKFFRGTHPAYRISPDRDGPQSPRGISGTDGRADTHDARGLGIYFLSAYFIQQSTLQILRFYDAH